MALGYRGHMELSLGGKPREGRSTVPGTAPRQVLRGGRRPCWVGMSHLVRFEGLLVSEEQLVPHHLHTLLRVHGQEGALDARHVPLVHLQGTGRWETATALPAAPGPPGERAAWARVRTSGHGRTWPGDVEELPPCPALGTCLEELRPPFSRTQGHRRQPALWSTFHSSPLDSRSPVRIQQWQ